MHFSLRTLLIATTVAAIYVGGLLGLMRTFQSSGISSPYILFHALCGLPIFILWCVAGEWALRNRSANSSARAMLAAVVIAAAWRLSSPVLQTLFFSFVTPGSGGFQIYSIFSSVLHATCEFTSWLLMSYAVVQAVRRDEPSVSAERHARGPLDAVGSLDSVHHPERSEGSRS